MLTIIVPGFDSYDELNNLFINEEDVQLEFEHSLFSLSKWESKWEVPFLANKKAKEKTDEQVKSYVQMMCTTPNVPSEVFSRLSQENYDDIKTHMDAKMTATWFSDRPGKQAEEIITAELIYHWMVALTIPFECQHWHLNRLLALIKVCNLKNNPEKPKKMSASDLAARNRKINEERKVKFGTSG